MLLAKMLQLTLHPRISYYNVKFVFLKYVGELRIFVLRREVVKYKTTRGQSSRQLTQTHQHLSAKRKQKPIPDQHRTQVDCSRLRQPKHPASASMSQINTEWIYVKLNFKVITPVADNIASQISYRNVEWDFMRSLLE